MKVSISVSRRSEAGDSTVQCDTSFDVQSVDQDALQQMTQAARHCAATIAAVAVNPAGYTNSSTTSYAAQTQHVKRLATEKQVKAIKAMAGRQGIDLPPILHDRFGASSPAALLISQASTLIDDLKNNLLPA